MNHITFIHIKMWSVEAVFTNTIHNHIWYSHWRRIESRFLLKYRHLNLLQSFASNDHHWRVAQIQCTCLQRTPQYKHRRPRNKVSYQVWIFKAFTPSMYTRQILKSWCNSKLAVESIPKAVQRNTCLDKSLEVCLLPANFPPHQSQWKSSFTAHYRSMYKPILKQS